MKFTFMIPITAIFVATTTAEPALRGLSQPCGYGAIAQEVVIDFEQDLEGYPLVAGDYLTYLREGVSLSAEGKDDSGYTAEGPRLFDTALPVDDPDLGSPNQRCGDGTGPGVGDGGEPGSDGENCEALGNVLIIQECDSCTPDDNAKGGTITMHFDPPVLSVDEIGLLDIDAVDGPAKVELISDSGVTVSKDVEGYGENSYTKEPLDAKDVTDLKVTFPMSGAIADVKVKKCLPNCKCLEEKEKLKVELEALKQQKKAFGDLITWLRGRHAELQAVSRKVLGEFDNFQVKIAGRCVLAGLEAVAVGKTVTALKAAATQGAFALQCLKVGIESKAVIHYLWTNKAVQEMVAGVALEVVAIAAKTQTEEKGWIYFVPIIGGACGAHDWSERMMNAPDLMKEIGNAQDRILAKIKAIKKLMKAKNTEVKAKEKELRDLIANCPKLK